MPPPTDTLTVPSGAPGSGPKLHLDELNAASVPDFTRLLDGTYEHSPWIAERAASDRPFATLAGLQLALRRGGLPVML